MPADPADQLLVTRIRRGDAPAWEDFIARYEGRLLAFVDSRLQNRAASEDVVQETFLGFLISLPNYDERTPLESWLFSIAAHKLTDLLRREGRRPSIPLYSQGPEDAVYEPAGPGRRASSLVQSQERRGGEERIIGECLRSLIEGWFAKSEFERLACMELLLVMGRTNKETAERLGISEQAVANHKHFVVSKLKEAATRSRIRDFNPADYGIG
jgi:RNA polymerase sigma-70 factor (ECF subfamily)